MNDTANFLTIAGVCGLVLMILFFKRKVETLVRFVIRGIVGTVTIYGVNQILIYFGIGTVVGINPITLLTSMILGIPGVCALYFIGFL